MRLMNPDSEYYMDAVERFRSLCDGRKLIANVDQKEGNILHLRLIDPADPGSAQDPFACINAVLLREGLASIDRRNCKYLGAYPELVRHLQECAAAGKRERLGMFEFGDIGEDDE